MCAHAGAAQCGPKSRRESWMSTLSQSNSLATTKEILFSFSSAYLNALIQQVLWLNFMLLD